MRVRWAPAVLCWLAVSAAAAAGPDSACWLASDSSGDAADPVALEQIGQARAGIATNPGQPELPGRLGMLLHAYESLDAARVCYAEAVALSPEEPRWRYYHAVVLARLGRIEEACTEVARTLELDSALAPAAALEAELLALSGAMEESEAAWRRTLELEPRSAPALHGLGQALAAQGKPDQAAAAFERAIAIEPGRAQARYAVALAYRRSDRLDDARREMAAYRRLDADDAPSPENELLAEVRALNRGSWMRVGMGAALARSGQADEAIRVFEEALKSNPRLAVAHANLIPLHAQSRRWAQAADHYRRAIEIDPNHADAHFNWGGVLAAQGRLPEAAEAFEKAVAAAPHNAQARLRLGEVYDALDQPVDAAGQYRLALESDPLLSDARRLLGTSLIASGRLEEGLDEMEKALGKGDSRAAEYLEGLARAHEADGRLDVALGYARRGLRRARADGRQDLAELLEAGLRRLEAQLEAVR
jgi:protein O-GlcNAc transferase